MSLVFLSFFVILYWLLQLGKVEFIQTFAPVFEAIKNAVHLFYQRNVVVDEATIDFSFLIATFIFLITAWVINFAVEGVEKLEEKYDDIHIEFKKRTEDVFNYTLAKEQELNEYRNNKFLILINFTLINIDKDKFYHRNTNEGMDEKRMAVLLDFLLNLDKNVLDQTTLFEGGILLNFQKFNEIENTIAYISNYMTQFRLKYKGFKIQVNFVTGIDTYANKKEIKDKANNLKLLLKLNAQNEILCLSSFKNRYSLIGNPMFNIENMGIYKLKGFEEEIFCIKN